MSDEPHDDDEEIAQALHGSEKNGAYASTVRNVVPVRSLGAEIVVMSDLHLGDGLRPDGTYDGSEHFFADEAFARLLDSLHRDLSGRPAILVLNGDVVDFLRLQRVPESDDELRDWATLTRRLGIPRVEAELRASIDASEREYGLRTNDYKSAWKLTSIAEGHRPFFRALATWIDRGHLLYLTKGNHDLEWYWRPVRDTLRLVFAERLAAVHGWDIPHALREVVTPRVRFFDHAVVFDGLFYVEHGHRFDKYSTVLGRETLHPKHDARLARDTKQDEGTELNIPFGSFFNRYLINKIELSYPFIDNVRPRENLLPVLLRENLWLGGRLLFQHLPLMVRMIRKRYWRYMFRTLLIFLLLVIVPLTVATLVAWHYVGITIAEVTAHLPTSVLDLLGRIGSVGGGLLLSYISARLVSHFQLAEPTSLADEAKAIFKDNPRCELCTLGHTHNPDQTSEAQMPAPPGAPSKKTRWFWNTGTWIPIIESSSTEIRHDRTYTFLRIPNRAGKPAPGKLHRWNDDAGRPEPALIMRRVGGDEADSSGTARGGA